MTGFDEQDLERRGFEGFVKISELRQGIQRVPSQKGLYAVLRLSESEPSFLPRSPASWFKGKDPTVSQADLSENWVHGAQTLYVGSADDLRARIDLLIEFSDAGQARSIFHWGGRLLWQLADSDDLVVAWKAAQAGIGSAQRDLVIEFREEFGQLPYANLRLPSSRTSGVS
jgi:hypothetical protein